MLINKNCKRLKVDGFTIVELIVIIIIIGILATISYVSYSNIVKKAAISALKADLEKTSSELLAYKSKKGEYPSSLSDVNVSANDGDTSYRYTVVDGSYCVAVTSLKNNVTYNMSSGSSEIKEGTCFGYIASGVTISTWKQISSGGTHTCAISSDDKAYCWGDNLYGQLGNNSTMDSSSPVAVDTTGVLNGKTIRSVSVGYSSTCAVASDNLAYCWGYGGEGQLGNNSTSQSLVPVAVDATGVLSGKAIESIDLSSHHVCAMDFDNKAYCWGMNDRGQLGNNSTTNSLVPVVVNTTGVLSGKTIKSIKTEYNSTCVIASDDEVYCWGNNYYGQLGNNSTTNSLVPVAVNTTGTLSGKTIKSIAGASFSVCAIASDDKAYCWGNNYGGQLGNNSTVQSLVPAAVDTTGILSDKTIKFIAAASYSVCAIASDNKVYCWGDNSYGQLGNNSTDNSNIPVAVNASNIIGSKLFKTVSVGGDYSCVINFDNESYCWGDNSYGQLGKNIASVDDILTPIAVNDTDLLSNKTITAISAGDHTCAIASSNNVYCWGDGVFSQPGKSVVTHAFNIVAISASGDLSGKAIKSISSGSYHTCAIASDDKAYCWGTGGAGQLGNNSTSQSSVPVAVDTTGVLNGKTIKSISSGVYAYHTCAIASDDEVYCWGNNNYGQLGNSSTTNSLIPIAVDATGALSGKTIKAISSGTYHTCAIASDDKAYCWGYNNHGQLGNNSTTQSLVPVAVDTAGVLSGKTIKQIDSGSFHTCVIASDDKAYCWGYDNHGQLGNNSTTQSLVPVAVDATGVLSGKTIKSISSGANHTCAIASDDRAYCWGYDFYGQLGNNSTTDSLVPVAVDATGVLSGKTIKSISAGNNHTCAIASDDRAYCWGANNYVQLGQKYVIAQDYMPFTPVTIY